MLGALLVATLLGAAGEVKLAAPGLTKLNLSPEQARFFSGHLAARLSSHAWLKVISADDISAVLGLERQKELLGCSEGKASCIAELAGALGVDGMLTGQVAQVGKSFQVNVKVIDTSANALFVYSSERLPTDEAVLDELNRIADLIAAKLEPLAGVKHAPNPEVTAEKVEAAPKPIFWPALGVTAAGVVVAGLGAFSFVTANQELNALQRAEPAGNQTTVEMAQGFRDRGKNWQLAGGILCGVGGAALVGGLLWYLLHSPGPASVAIGFDGHGGWAGVRVVLP